MVSESRVARVTLFSHLAAENCTISNAPVRVRDAPRFEFRGLMIDVSAAAPSGLPYKSNQKLLRACADGPPLHAHRERVGVHRVHSLFL